MKFPWRLKRQFSFSGPMQHPEYSDYLARSALDPIVHVELTSQCNFHCFYCISPNSPRVKGFMEKRLFERILPQLAELTTSPIRLHIDGEPTLHPNFDEFVNALNAAGHHIGLATNGSALKPEMLQHEMNLRIHVSHSAEDLATRSKMNYETYIGKITKYVRAWSASSVNQNLDFNLYYLHDPKSPLDTASYQLDFVADFLRRCGLLEANERPPQLPFATHNAAGHVMKLKTSAVATGGVFAAEGRKPYAPSEDGFCDSAWKTLAILSDGRVTYCCMDLTGGTAFTEPGEIWESSVRELWLEHPEIVRVRNEILAAKIKNPVCQTCLASRDYCQNRELYMQWGAKFEAPEPSTEP